LIDEIGIVDGGETFVVSRLQGAVQPAADGVEAAWNDECGVAEIYESDFSTIEYSPAASQFCRETCLSAM
jgi:hypothetical protein